MLKQNQNVSVRVEIGDDSISEHGKFLAFSDDFVFIEGTVGDSIGKIMAIPRERIISITVLS